MDLLKAELAGKRKGMKEDPTLPSRPNKYMRRGDVDRLRQEQEQKVKEEKEQEQKSKALEKVQARLDISAPASRSMSPSGPLSESTPSHNPNAFNISNEDAIRRLRAKGQPIRLFAESDKDRRLRLRALELIEEKAGSGGGGGGLNDFRRVLAEMEQGLDVEEAERRMLAAGKDIGESATKSDAVKGPASDDKTRSTSTKSTEATTNTSVLDLSLVQKDPNKLYPLIYHALKKVLKEWEQAMAERPDHIKRSTQGKLAAATQASSAEYLKPLFKLLKQRDLPNDVLARMSEIVHHMQMRQYQRANDSYLRLSIGNAPWPIGVTMVGIHERSAREKISADLVAHVLNDEVSRKYIQSLKRLLTFHQTKYPPEDISQLMG